MARCGCSSGCACAIIAGTNTSVTGDGSPGSPYTISAVAAPLVAGDGDCITLTGDGSAASPLVAAPVLDPDPTNLLACGPDGLLVAGGTGGTVATGCGLVGDGSTDAPVRAFTRTWAYPCDVVATAGGVFCDTNGVLRSEPRTRVTFVSDSANQTNAATAVPAAETTVATHNLTINNPDTCRPAIAYVSGMVDVDFTLPSNSFASVGIDGDDLVGVANRGASAAAGVHAQATKTWRVSVPAGGSVVEPLIITMGSGAGGATYTRVQWSISALVISV